MYWAETYVLRIKKNAEALVVDSETGSNKLREEHRLGLFENRLLWKIFDPKTKAVTGKWTRLHKEELNDMHSDDQMKEMIGASSTYGREERYIHNVTGETRGKETTWKTQA
jgi:hypothetical protein